MKAMTFKETHEPFLYLEDDRYWAEQKMDGARMLSRYNPVTDECEFLQRNGSPMKFAAAVQHLSNLHSDLKRIGEQYPDLWLDGELMTETGEYRVWDILDLTKTYRDRRVLLKQMSFPVYLFISFVPVAKTVEQKRELLASVREGNGEGVMFKDHTQLYEPGGRVAHSVKFKFVKSADVIVLSYDKPDPRHGSAVLGVLDSDGSARVVGNCSLIGKPDVRKNDVIEVNYLYWGGKAMVQPRMVRRRDDKIFTECTFDQFPVYSRDCLWTF